MLLFPYSDMFDDLGVVGAIICKEYLGQMCQCV